MKYYVKPLVETILEIPEIQDCAVRSCVIFNNSSMANIPYVKTMVTGINGEVDAISAARQYDRVNSETATTSEADSSRDRRFTIFKKQAIATEYLTEDEPEVADAGAKMVTIIGKHNSQLQRLSRAKQSAALMGLFTELDLPENQILLETAGLTRAYTKLKESQALYIQAEEKKITVAGEKGDYISPAISASNIIYRLEALYSHLDGWALDQFSKHEETVNAINEIIDSVMIPARARQTRKQENAS